MGNEQLGEGFWSSIKYILSICTLEIDPVSPNTWDVHQGFRFYVNPFVLTLSLSLLPLEEDMKNRNLLGHKVPHNFHLQSDTLNNYLLVKEQSWCFFISKFYQRSLFTKVSGQTSMVLVYHWISWRLTQRDYIWRDNSPSPHRAL